MGLIPFCSTFAVFAGRNFEQIRNGVCYPHNNVKFAFTHAGVTVGEDGGTHQAIEDIALMRVLPGMTVIVPCDANETYKAVEAAAAIDGPVYLRLARLATTVFDPMPFEVGKGNVIRDGKDAVIFTCGIMVEQCLETVEILKEKGMVFCGVPTDEDEWMKRAVSIWPQFYPQIKNLEIVEAFMKTLGRQLPR